MRKWIFCHDGSLGPMIAKQNTEKTWGIYGISQVRGMGDADYENKLFEADFDELVLLNSFSGIAYVCMNKNSKWGLMEVKENRTLECEWKLVSEFTFGSYEELLIHFAVDSELFSVERLGRYY